MHKYIVKGAQLTPNLKANLDIARHSKTLTVKVDLGDGFIIEFIRDEINGKSTWTHVINGKIYVSDKAPELFCKALRPHIANYNVYRSDAVRSGKVVALFGGKESPSEVIDAIRPEEVVA